MNMGIGHSPFVGDAGIQTEGRALPTAHNLRHAGWKETGAATTLEECRS
jgi:hypothetical protein